MFTTYQLAIRISQDHRQYLPLRPEAVCICQAALETSQPMVTFGWLWRCCHYLGPHITNHPKNLTTPWVCLILGPVGMGQVTYHYHITGEININSPAMTQGTIWVPTFWFIAWQNLVVFVITHFCCFHEYYRFWPRSKYGNMGSIGLRCERPTMTLLHLWK